MDASGVVQGYKEYTVDDKNNAMQNILGFNKIAFAYSSGESNGIFHNQLSVATYDVNDPTSNSTFTFLGKYNNLDYPTVIYPGGSFTENSDFNVYHYFYN